MQKTLIILGVLFTAFLPVLAKAAMDTEEAIKACGKANTPCISAYSRMLYYMKKSQQCEQNSVALSSSLAQKDQNASKLKTDLDKCVSDKAVLKTQLDQCQYSLSFSPPPPPSSSDGNCIVSLKNQATILAKIKAMDATYVLPPDAALAIKKACAISTTNVSLFVEAFLCNIQASTEFKSDPQIIQAIDDLEGVDLDNKSNFCN